MWGQRKERRSHPADEAAPLASAPNGARLIAIRQVSHEAGRCWVAEVPARIPGDTEATPAISSLRLFEDGRELGPAHALHDDIRRLGGGRFSHWGGSLFFSSSDGSDPGRNDRHYIALAEAAGADARTSLLTAALGADPDDLTSEQRYAWGERLFNLFVPDAKIAEFGRSFYRDVEFLRDYERFDRENYRSLDRKFALKELLKLTLALPGDAAECGVFRGASAFIIAKSLIASESGKRLHLFDSFTGLSAPSTEDGDYWQAGVLACSRAQVEANLAPVAAALSFHPGWIPEGFDAAAAHRFAFVHLDVDLYQPTRDALQFFYPRLVPGGVLVCDDYGFDTCPGARRAMDDFFIDKPEPVIHLPTGQGFVLRAPS